VINESLSKNNVVRNWLLIGMVMVFIQVIVGGITRLTESGLSITKWEVVSGTLPPMSEPDWITEFELYKTTPQYTEVNEGMTMSDFKFIYFWEYIHRFWARIMGFVFLFPFLYFYFVGMISRPLLRRLGLVVLLAILAATFGWIMVASGLIQRPWVNAYKLSLHLCIAMSVFVALFWAYLHEGYGNMYKSLTASRGVKTLLPWVMSILILQLFLGGVMSGMRAAVVFPTWPDMNGIFVPSIIFDPSQWSSSNFNNYDQNEFMPALIHFMHRTIAYVLFGLGILFAYRIYDSHNSNVVTNSSRKSLTGTRIAYVIVTLLFLQVVLGIITVVSSQGSVPVLWGVLHQAGALLLLSSFVVSIFVLEVKN